MEWWRGRESVVLSDVFVCVCVCVRARARVCARMCVCVCMCARARRLEIKEPKEEKVGNGGVFRQSADGQATLDLFSLIA